MCSFEANHKPLTNANHLMTIVINQDIGGQYRTEMVKKANTRRRLDTAKSNQFNNNINANGFFYSLWRFSSFPLHISK